jgi:hypothetical protein
MRAVSRISVGVYHSVSPLDRVMIGREMRAFPERRTLLVQAFWLRRVRRRLLLSACASSTTPTTTTAPTVNIAGIQNTLKTIQPALDAAAAAVMSDATASATTKEQVGAAQVAFDAAVNTFIAVPATANNIPALANAVASAANAVVSTLPLASQQKTDVSLALGLVETVGSVVINSYHRLPQQAAQPQPLARLAAVVCCRFSNH